MRKTRQTQRQKTGKPTSQKDKPSISIIGAGRLGTALGIALRAAGYGIDLVVAKRAASAKRAAALIGRTIGLSHGQLASRQSDLALQSSVIIIATPDDVITEVADELAAKFRLTRPRRAKRIALHTSGALSSRALESLERQGFLTGSLHPLVSISEPRAGAEWLSRSYFSLEGKPAAIRSARQMVRDLGGHSFTIKAEDKALYHAAALMASPNMTALFDVALEMLNRCGLSPARARQVLLPLARSTLQNLSTQSPSAALTGTFKRADISTVRKHLAAIESQRLRDALEAYVLLGRRSLSLAKSNKIARRQEIELVLTRALERGRR